MIIKLLKVGELNFNWTMPSVIQLNQIKKIMTLISLVGLSGCDFVLSFVDYSNSHRFELVVSESFDENRRTGSRVVKSVRASDIVTLINHKIPDSDLQTIQQGLTVNLVVENKRNVYVECIAKLPIKQSKVAIEVCSRKIQQQIASEKNAEKVEIGGKFYTESQIRTFLKDIYSKNQTPNLATWDIFPSKELTVEFRGYSLFPKGTRQNDQIVSDVLDLFEALFGKYTKAANLDFVWNDKGSADLSLIFTPDFKHYKNDKDLKSIDLGDVYTEQDALNRDKHWDDLSANPKNIYRTGTLWFVPEGSEIHRLTRAYQIIRWTNIGVQKFGYLASKAICDVFISRTGHSDQIEDSCAADFPKIDSYLDPIDFNDADKYIYPFDLALIKAIYKNPKISELDIDDAIEEITKNLMDNHRVRLD